MAKRKNKSNSILKYLLAFILGQLSVILFFAFWVYTVIKGSHPK